MSLVAYREAVRRLKNNEDPGLDNDLQAQAVAPADRLTGLTDTLVDRVRQHLAVRSGDVAGGRVGIVGAERHNLFAERRQINKLGTVTYISPI